jgi:hypothetical protein
MANHTMFFKRRPLLVVATAVTVQGLAFDA